MCEWIFLSGTEPGAGEGGKGERKRGVQSGGREDGRRRRKTREGGGGGVGSVIREAQVLLLMHPGAELGRAGLSETLPSCEAGDVWARA